MIEYVTAIVGLARAGRYKRVTRDPEVKESRIEGKVSVPVRRNEGRAGEDAQHRDVIVVQLQAEFAAGGMLVQRKNGAMRYHKLTRTGSKTDCKKGQRYAELDGNLVTGATTDHLPPEQAALALRGLWRAENAFPIAKTLRIAAAVPSQRSWCS